MLLRKERFMFPCNFRILSVLCTFTCVPFWFLMFYRDNSGYLELSPLPFVDYRLITVKSEVLYRIFSLHTPHCPKSLGVTIEFYGKPVNLFHR